MAAKGRPRKPLPELLLEGNYREDRHGSAAETWQPEGSPDRPAWLAGDALALWQTLTPALARRGVATAVDSAELAALCDWWARYRAAATQLDALAGPQDKDYYKLAILAGMAWKNFASAAAKFGLNPSDRAKLRLDASDKDKDELLAFTKRDA